MTYEIVAITEYCNERDNVESLVKNMMNQTVTPDLWLVIDDGSTDDTTTLFLDNLDEYAISSELVKIPPKETPDANNNYHRIYIDLTSRLYEYTNVSIFRFYSEKWRQYDSKPLFTWEELTCLEFVSNG